MLLPRELQLCECPPIWHWAIRLWEGVCEGVCSCASSVRAASGHRDSGMLGDEVLGICCLYMCTVQRAAVRCRW